MGIRRCIGTIAAVIAINVGGAFSVYADQPQNTGGDYVFTIGAALFVAGIILIVLSQTGAKRRHRAAVARSEAFIADSLAQNKRIIELLESIDKKTPGPKA
jgi:hypothetical protein